MIAATTIREIAVYAMLAMLAAWPITSGLLRYRVRRVFGTGPSDPIALETVRRTLDRVHEHSRDVAFGVERVTSLFLAGRTVTLVYGLIGFGYPLQGNIAKRVYAVAEGDEIAWMQRFPDVFEPAVTTPEATVFWVRMSALMRLAKGASEPRGALRETL